MKKKIWYLMFFCMIFVNCNAQVETAKTENGTIDKNVSKDLQDIIRMASLAPSSHNSQMWKIKILSDKEFLICWDSERKLFSSDPQNREALISIGAFIENFCEGSKKYNYEAQVEVYDKIREDNSVAKIVLRDKSFGNTEKIVANIEERHSIKTPFFNKDLEKNDLDAFLGIDKNIFYYDVDSKEGQYLKNSVYEAYVKEAHNAQTTEELAQWIRISDKEAKQKKDGMNAEMMGMKGLLKYFYYAITTEKSYKSDFFINSGIKVAKKQAENCSGYIVIKSDSNEVFELINTGRVMEKLLLKANEMKVAVHPMSQMLHEEPWKNEVSDKLSIEGETQMILRVGYVKNYGKPTSLRRDISDIIIF